MFGELMHSYGTIYRALFFHCCRAWLFSLFFTPVFKGRFYLNSWLYLSPKMHTTHAGANCYTVV